jgi:hypothetical protein
MRTPEQIIGKDRLLQLIFEGYEVVKVGTKCPFGKGRPDPGISPTDPCPVCGDLGTFDNETPSRCIEP